MRGGVEGLPKPDETIRIYQFDEPSNRFVATVDFKLFLKLAYNS